MDMIDTKENKKLYINIGKCKNKNVIYKIIKKIKRGIKTNEIYGE